VPPRAATDRHPAAGAAEATGREQCPSAAARRLPDLTGWSFERVARRSHKSAHPSRASVARARDLLAGDAPGAYGTVDTQAMHADPAYRLMMAECESAYQRLRGSG